MSWGVTVVSGDQWRDEEVAHTLRLLEIVGRTDIPVVPGGRSSRSSTARRRSPAGRSCTGRVNYQGAWNEKPPSAYGGWWTKRGYLGPFEVPDLPEGNPTTKPAAEDAAHFLVRMARARPHEVTLYVGGPFTNVALAVAIDHEFPTLIKELVVMGASLRPVAEGTFMADSTMLQPRREFNYWWDPEATRMALRAPWPKVTVTTVGHLGEDPHYQGLIEEIGRAQTPPRSTSPSGRTSSSCGTEIAALAWLDPSLITKQRPVFMDIDIDHGAGYGNTLTWAPGNNPGLGEQQVIIQEDLDLSTSTRCSWT
jgi:hypothetical protein